LMPLIGYFLGSRFQVYIERFDHWVVFVLLAFIGGKMIFDALREEEEEPDTSLAAGRAFFAELTLLAVATSIDALAVGVSLALLPGTNLPLSVAVIGVTTFVLSLVGVVVGNRFGARFRRGAQVAGGVILVLIGLKILLEHLGIL